MLESVQGDDGQFRVRATVRRVGVYLDNHSIINLAKGPVSRRERFIEALNRGADLMFSDVSAAEIIGPEHHSTIEPVRAFLSSVGPNWFPLEGAGFAGVLDREAAGVDRSSACTSHWLMEHYFAARNIQLHGEQRQGHVSTEFFDLSFFLDWLHPQRADIRRRVEDFEQRLSATLSKFRVAYEGNKAKFESMLPPPRYDASRPATFVWEGLVRTLVLEQRAYQFKQGDGSDLCHAVMASAFATFATLDRQWKRRIVSLPKPNRLARIYYAPELDALIEGVEAAVA